MMLRTLLESKASPNRRAGGTIISVAIHTAAIALAVAATARATSGPPPRERFDPPPVFVVPPTPVHHDDAVVATGDPPIASTVIVDKKVLIPPIVVPTYIPDIDRSRPPVDAGDFGHGPIILGRGPEKGLSSGKDSVFTVLTVERAAAARPDNPAPVYPSALRAAQIEGSVIARFIVDTLGRAEPASINFPSATHDQFTEAVRQAVLHSRYLPAMFGDHPVRQLVEQRFEFALRR